MQLPCGCSGGGSPLIALGDLRTIFNVHSTLYTVLYTAHWNLYTENTVKHCVKAKKFPPIFLQQPPVLKNLNLQHEHIALVCLNQPCNMWLKGDEFIQLHCIA